MVQERYGSAETPHDSHHHDSPFGFDPNHAIEVVTKVTRENPHAALAGAVVVGFVLGGGMTPRLLGAIAMLAARQTFRATVEETLASLQSTIEGRREPQA
jgi:hypothetical protein